MKLEGWATVNDNGVNGTTGGGNATPVTVTSFDQLSAAVAGNTARVIVISGTIRTTDGGGSALRIGSNKTLMGANRSATIYGGIEMNGVSNVIIRNLNIQGTWPNSGPDDTVASITENFRRVCAESDRVAFDHDLDDTANHARRGPVSLRWIYVHMIEELARHAGHGDILREQVLASRS